MSRSIRRSPEQWQELIHQWKGSNRSALQFCQSEGVGYASFCQWRKRLSEGQINSPSISPASFIDLGNLANHSPNGGWNVVLSLGNGIELHLSQG